MKKAVVILFFILIISAGLYPQKINSEVRKMIEQMGGGIPKNDTIFFDGEIMSLKGEATKLYNYKGKVIFLNLWATWCPPCRAEMPSLEKLNKNFKDKNFALIAVSQGEDLKTVTKFLEKNNYTFSIFIDNKNNVAEKYSSGSIPTTYIIGKDGYILAQFVGGRDWNSKEANNLINALL